MFPFTWFKFTACCSPVFIVASGEFLSGLDSKSAVFSEGFSVQELQHKERISILPWVRMRSCCYFMLLLAVLKMVKVNIFQPV